jgi:alkyl hydroperoxide reductase subunit AhpC/predicted Ser/Thr protein kinase
MQTPTVTVGQRAPDFGLQCTRGPEPSRRRVALADYQGRWLILAFYPRDFSLVCPGELTALSVRIKEFHRRGCDLLAVSTDSLETHEKWLATPRALGGLGELHFPLASDGDGAVSRAFGVYLERQHVALRGLFIIDPNGVLQYQSVHNLSVGRRSEEVLRVLAALETGGMCPEDWCADCETLDATQALAPGSMLSHYQVEREVGRGTFGAVYRARDTILDRTVAIKVFRPDSMPTAVLAEARSAAALNHPNVCTIFSVEDSEGVPVIVMEYIGGRPLNAVLQDGALPESQAAAVARQVASGMAAAHALGVVHGDLKPANILLGDTLSVKITDFGLSRRAPRNVDAEATRDWRSSESGRIAGTPCYMSPEQSRGDRVTPASDVFSFGALLYELLTGRRAFDGDNVLRVLDRIRKADAEKYAAEVAEPFAGILRQALISDPRRRVVTMEKIAEMLGDGARSVKSKQ